MKKATIGATPKKSSPKGGSTALNTMKKATIGPTPVKDSKGRSTESRKTNLPGEKGSGSQVARQKSAFDHLESHMSHGELKTFIYRMTIVGSHEGPPEQVRKLKEELVNEINATCYDEPATGIFAVYERNFLHVVEGSEDTLNKYILACKNEFEETGDENNSKENNDENSQPPKNPFKLKMKILCFVRVYTRSTEKWISMMRTEYGAYDVQTQAPGFRNRLFEFIKSSWILLSVVPIFTQPKDVAPMQNMMDFPDPEDQLRVVEAEKNLMLDLDLELNKYFPTKETLQYFMKPKNRLPPIRTPKEHIERTWDLPKMIFDSETVWPIPCRFAPYD